MLTDKFWKIFLNGKTPLLSVTFLYVAKYILSYIFLLISRAHVTVKARSEANPKFYRLKLAFISVSW